MEALNLEQSKPDYGIARCPQCGHEFKPWLVMQVRDVAVMFGVKVATVSDWIARAGLRCRLYRLGRLKVRRVVLSTDLLQWMETKLAYPGDGSDTSKLYAFYQERGRLGAAARARNKARRAALIGPPANSSDQSTP